MLRAMILDDFRERFDEGVLLFDRPAVVPRANRPESRDQSFRFFHMASLNHIGT